MKTYYLKIRDKYITDIKNRVKKHEYRLASPERMQAKVGDTFVLISNQNKDNFVRATIKGIKVYSSWNEALIENWEQDFKNIFASLDATLKECYKFYSKDEVDRYGIAVFEIEPLYIDYSKSSVLLDTNIFIKRESSNNVSFEINNLFKWLDKKQLKKYLHKSTIEELKLHKDEKIKNAMLAKASSYDILPSFTSEKDDYFEHTVNQYSQDANNMGGSYIDGYKYWLENNNFRSPLYLSPQEKQKLLMDYYRKISTTTEKVMIYDFHKNGERQ